MSINKIDEAMKKTILSMLLLIVATTMGAQSLLLGDTTQDGELSIDDVTKTVNMVLAPGTQTTIDLTGMAYQVDNTVMMNKHFSFNGIVVKFNADGTTDYPNGYKYEFRPLQGTLLVLDREGQPVKTLHVVRIGEEEILLQDYTTGQYVNCMSNYEYVDLGLPSGTLWATFNIGATSPEQCGDYFAWGETAPKSDYSWSTYAHCDGTNSTMTKYCSNSRYGIYDGKTTLDAEDDAATVNWGSKWCTPTKEQFDELNNLNYVSREWVQENGVYGCRITSKENGRSIFLPATGIYEGTSLTYVGTYGRYWSQTVNTDAYSQNPYITAYQISFVLQGNNNLNFSLQTSNRSSGRTIRPVRKIEN